jgi:hypothetical protein
MRTCLRTGFTRIRYPDAETPRLAPARKHIEDRGACLSIRMGFADGRGELNAVELQMQQQLFNLCDA